MLANYRRLKRMKRVLAISFAMLILCFLLLVGVGVTKASEADYNVIEAYQTAMPVTVDGNWATGEWDDSWIEYISNGTVTDDRFAYKMDSGTGTYYMSWLFDFSDNTTDAGDIWQLCIDGVPGDESTAPSADCTKIEITGHTTMTVYQGDGEDWVETDALDSAIIWADNMTIHDVPFDYPHYCLEIQADKAALGDWGGNPPPNGFRVAMYDESNPSQGDAGWIAWPPTSEDDPSSWGLIYTYETEIPEGFSIVLVVLLLSVAVAVALYSVRKRPKTQSYSSAKTGINTL
jgi:hypothetical protein